MKKLFVEQPWALSGPAEKNPEYGKPLKLCIKARPSPPPKKIYLKKKSSFHVHFYLGVEGYFFSTYFVREEGRLFLGGRPPLCSW